MVGGRAGATRSATARRAGGGWSAGCGRRRPGRGASAGAAPYDASGRAAGGSRTCAASRYFSAADIEATSRWRSTSAVLAAARTTSSACSLCLVAVLERERRHDGLGRRRRPRAGQPVAGVEEGLEDLVEARQVVGAARTAWRGRRMRTAAGSSAPSVGGRGQEVVGTVLGDRYAAGPQGAGEREQDLVAAPDRRVRSLPRPSLSRRRSCPEQLVQRVLHAVGVLAVLHQRSERAGGRLEVELGGAEVVQGARPVDGLGDAGRLLQVAAAQLLDDRDDLPWPAPRTPRARGSARSAARARGRGARSSGRDSGA